ncbi:MAG TPA: hypothetical protein VFV92_13955 [Candidatus Bathyarchaeia archaeon]|nr:hypothetical protein [Candidatus Bathyarchaeia archaeon]
MDVNGFRSRLGLGSRRRIALAVATIAMLAAIGGAYAVNIAITQISYSAEQGTYHNNSGGITATDNGLAPVANAITTNVTSAVTWGATGTNKQVYTTMTAGDLMDYITFSTTLNDSSTHTATVTIRHGAGALGSTIVTVISGTWTAPSATSTATITMFIDLGAQTVSSPITVYVTVT